MKKLSSFLAALLLLMVAVPNAKAIIYDPDDYLIYDPGPMAPVNARLYYDKDTFIFNAPGDAVRFINTSGVSFKDTAATWGRGITSADQVAAMGWTGYAYEPSVTKVSYIWIGENEKVPYVYTKLQWKDNQDGCDSIKDKYRWWYNEASTNYNRPSDSMIIRVPANCDSVFIQAGGSNSGYGLIVYQKDLGFDNGYYNGGNWGMGFNEIGFKPVKNGQDSIDIVVMGAFKDWFTSSERWKDSGSKTFMQIPLSTALIDYVESERWGQFRGVGINRIKIYGPIEESVIPPFDGTVAGWDFEYVPKESGTVDLDQPSGKIVAKNTYLKYASDLGVKRFMMTSTGKGFCVGTDVNTAGKTILSGKLARLTVSTTVPIDTLGNYADGSKHSTYYQFEGKATGCQDLSFNFDFALRSSKDISKIVVLGLPADSTNWTLLGEYENADKKGTSFVSVSQVLPENYANKSFAIRVMLAGTEKQLALGSSYIFLANVALKGYDDYYEKNEDAKKVAYISNATDRVHILDRATTADSTDAFLKDILTGADYDVKVFTQEETKDLSSEEAIKSAFKDFDLVILSEYPGSGDDVVKNAKYLIGYKPFLNLKAFAYKNWGLSGYTCKDGDVDTLAYLGSDKFSLHPLFNDLSLNTDSASGKVYLPGIFKTHDNGTKYFQGVEYSADGAVNTHFLAQGINDALNCIVEDYTKESAKYMLVAISATQNANLNSNATKLLKNAMNYLLAGGHFEAPTFNLVSDGAVVENMADLKAALAYNYSVIGISNPIIYMKHSTDESGSYTFGEMQVRNAVTMKPYESEEVKVDGTFVPVSTNVGSLTFNGIGFTSAVPFRFTGAKQKLSKGLFFENCNFSNIKTLLSSDGSDSCQVEAISVKNSVFTAEAEGALVELKDCFQLDSIYFGENVIKATSKQLLSAQGTNPKDSTVVAAIIEHNQFMFNDAASTVDFINYDLNTFEKKQFNIQNNIFYKAGAAAVRMPVDTFSYSTALNNLMIETTADWSAVMDTISVLTLSGLGIEDPFAAGADSKIVKNSPLYKAGTDRTYVGPKSLYIDRTTAETVKVKNAVELKDALEIAIDGDIIELADYEMAATDSIDAYVLSGVVLPTNGANLTIRAAEGATPRIIGNILGTSAANIGNLTISGLKWEMDDMLANYNNESYGAAFISVKDYVIKGTLTFANCSFISQEKPLLRIKEVAGTYIGKLVYNGCTIDNHGGNVEDGTSGGHLFQLDKSAAYTFNNFEFTNNIVTNYHGGQVFNLSRLGSATEGEKAIRYNISNNLFYAFGGAAKTASNFLEFKETPAECSVDITIANNIFYERYSDAGQPVANIVLYNHGTELSNSVVVTHNFYEGKYYTEELLGANPVSLSNHTGNLLQNPANEEISVTYIKQMDKDSLGIEEVFSDIDNLRISKESKMYTAGVDGTYLGPEPCYTGKPVGLGSNERNDSFLSVASFNGQLLINAPEDSILEIFNVMGQLVVKASVKQGVNEIGGLAVGNIYLVRAGDSVAKIVIR